MKIPSINR